MYRLSNSQGTVATFGVSLTGEGSNGVNLSDLATKTLTQVFGANVHGRGCPESSLEVLARALNIQHETWTNRLHMD